MSDFFSFGLGASTRSAAGDILETWYPLPLKQPEGVVAEAEQQVGNVLATVREGSAEALDSPVAEGAPPPVVIGTVTSRPPRPAI